MSYYYLTHRLQALLIRRKALLTRSEAPPTRREDVSHTRREACLLEEKVPLYSKLQIKTLTIINTFRTIVRNYLIVLLPK